MRAHFRHAAHAHLLRAHTWGCAHTHTHAHLRRCHLAPRPHPGRAAELRHAPLHLRALVDVDRNHRPGNGRWHSTAAALVVRQLAGQPRRFSLTREKT